MQLKRMKLLSVLSEALDCIEQEFLGVTNHHAKRVALLCDRMAEHLELSGEEKNAVFIGALLHDSALNEHREAYLSEVVPISALKGHCIAGEDNLRLIPGVVSCNFVLYHHENADGSGPFGKTAGQTPLGAQLIHIADQLDRCHPLSDPKQAPLHILREYIERNRDTLFASCVCDAMLHILSEELLNALSDQCIEAVPTSITDHPCQTDLRALSALFARIIDYKSPFTKNHSIGLAEKAERMAHYYHWDESTVEQLYCAGALHDVGKLMVDRDVLEKPGKLDKKEYQHIQSHAYETFRLLSKLEGLEAITHWASRHHEKLNGTGYPFGLSASQLDEKSRLLACLDIYQALTEDRPYKAGMSHAKAMSILQELAEKGELDCEITKDIGRVFHCEERTDDEMPKALFQCPVCGHIYTGDTMPQRYDCPVCGQPETAFRRLR